MTHPRDIHPLLPHMVVGELLGSRPRMGQNVVPTPVLPMMALVLERMAYAETAGAVDMEVSFITAGLDPQA